jgi:uncharacterized protein (UPF0210 family)
MAIQRKKQMFGCAAQEIGDFSKTLDLFGTSLVMLVTKKNIHYIRRDGKFPLQKKTIWNFV